VIDQRRLLSKTLRICRSLEQAPCQDDGGRRASTPCTNPCRTRHQCEMRMPALGCKATTDSLPYPGKPGASGAVIFQSLLLLTPLDLLQLCTQQSAASETSLLGYGSIARPLVALVAHPSTGFEALVLSNTRQPQHRWRPWSLRQRGLDRSAGPQPGTPHCLLVFDISQHQHTGDSAEDLLFSGQGRQTCSG
jgi:hypothetical protein